MKIILKKSSQNAKITAYLGKRDFVDHINATDPIDGIVLIDEEYIKRWFEFLTFENSFKRFV